MSEEYAIRVLADKARSFAKLTPRKNPTAGYARALAELFAAAREFAVRSDESWAKEVVELKEALKRHGDG